MADLTSMYKTTTFLVENGDITGELRPYLGLSGLGHGCSRFLWYSFRWYYEDVYSKRMARLWDRGHREEAQIIEILRRIGYEVDETQQEIVDVFGHVKGHNDGTVLGVVEAPKTKHLLEVKTMNDKYFKDLLKKTVKKSKPVYYVQVQMYMHYLKLTRTLFVAVNKNDDSVYFERIKYDKAFAEDQVRKAEMIVLSEDPPARAYPSVTFFECNWCSAKDICWKKAKPVKNCRTCKYSGPNVKGGWDCSWIEERPVEIPNSIQRKGCRYYDCSV